MSGLDSVERHSDNTLALSKYPGARPYWVADMSFATPDPILAAIKKRVEEGHFSYPCISAAVYNSIQHWCRTRYDWDIDTNWIVLVPTVMQGVNIGLLSASVTKTVFLQRPNFSKILAIPANFKFEVNFIETLTSRKPFNEVDLVNIASTRPSAIILCNPTNPNGIVSAREDLKALADCVAGFETVVISDEAHSDILLRGHRHIPAGSVPGLASKTITVLSPSKTFNLAGLSLAYAVIPSTKIRERFISTAEMFPAGINALGLVALESAYQNCSQWLDKLLAQLRINQDILVEEFKKTPIPYVPADSLYLAWVDTRHVGCDVFSELLKRGIAVSDGSQFGSPGWIRLNFACSEQQLRKATGELISLLGGA